MNIGEKIKQLRKHNNFTQEDLAKKIKKSQITIRKYESGEINPPINVLKQLCSCFNISVEDFIKHKQHYTNTCKENTTLEIIEIIKNRKKEGRINTFIQIRNLKNKFREIDIKNTLEQSIYVDSIDYTFNVFGNLTDIKVKIKY